MDKIKVELKKTERLNGETWYHVWADSDCLGAFMVVSANPNKALEEATECYDKIVERVKRGFPKVETVLFFDSATAAEPSK